MQKKDLTHTLSSIKSIVVDTIKRMVNLFPDLSDESTLGEIKDLEANKKMGEFIPMNHPGFDSAYDVEFISLANSHFASDLPFEEPLLFSLDQEKRNIDQISQTIFGYIENDKEGES